MMEQAEAQLHSETDNDRATEVNEPEPEPGLEPEPEPEPQHVIDITGKRRCGVVEDVAITLDGNELVVDECTLRECGVVYGASVNVAGRVQLESPVEVRATEPEPKALADDSDEESDVQRARAGEIAAQVLAAELEAELQRAQSEIEVLH